MIWKIIEICVLFMLSLFTSSIIIRVLERKQATEKTWRKPLLGFLLFAGLLSYFNGVASGVLVFFFIVAMLASAYVAKKEDKRLLIKLSKVAGISATFAIIANFLRDLQFGFRSENLYWLIAPVVFYLILGILDRKYATAKPKGKVNFDFILPLTATVVLTVIAVLVFNYSKGVIK